MEEPLSVRIFVLPQGDNTMVELLDNGSVAVVAPPVFETVSASCPDGAKGRLYRFVSKYSNELTSLRATDLHELTRQVVGVALQHTTDLPYDVGTAAVKIVNRWQVQDVDGKYTIRKPDFAYCS